MATHKVMLAGFNKCGTRSFAHLFEGAELGAVHHKLGRPFRRTALVGRLVDENIAAGRRPFEGFEHLTLYADILHVAGETYSEGNRHFRAVLEAYPEAHVVLNTRDREDWIKSRLGHGHGEFAQRSMAVLDLPNLEALTDKWREDWDTQHAAVRAAAAEFPGRIHEMNLDTDPISKLIDALPVMGLQADDWGDTGRSRGRATTGLRPSLDRVWAHIRPRRKT